VVVSVADQGVGFDMKYQERIFGIFERLHRQEEYPGTGVGLAIVRKVAERHGGRAWAESEVGRGSVFYFAVPATV
jgi:light-regulated signal transduction histidine kinase (bacteriophytochrome)